MAGSFPTVTITVKGANADLITEDDGTLENALFMAYVQAVKGDKRQQFVVFTPPLAALGCEAGNTNMLYLQRMQEFKGNRSKWFHCRTPSGKAFAATLASLEQDGWVVGAEVVVPLEKDDYLAAYRGETPHKALRAVNRALTPLGYTVK